LTTAGCGAFALAEEGAIVLLTLVELAPLEHAVGTIGVPAKQRTKLND